MDANEKRKFRMRSLPLDGGFDVKVTGAGATEDDIYIEYCSDRVVILTGDAAMQRRLERLNEALPAASSPRAVPRPSLAPGSRDNLPDIDIRDRTGWDGIGPEPPEHRARRDPQAAALAEVGLDYQFMEELLEEKAAESGG